MPFKSKHNNSDSPLINTYRWRPAMSLLLLSLPLAVSAESIDFISTGSLLVGTEPRSVAIGDFNDDGQQDLAVANQTSNNVSVLLGNGNGTFSTQLTYSVSSDDPVSIAVADFNGDGFHDIVTANLNAYDISVLLGNGDGTFDAAVNYDAGTGSRFVAVADFNGDNRPDLAVANQTSDNLSVLLGNSDGTFQSQTTYTTGNVDSPRSIAIGDFNADGSPDLALACYGTYVVNIFLNQNNGTGTFSSGSFINTSNRPYSVAVGDFNGDNSLDLVIGTNNFVLMSTGQGNGVFNSPSSIISRNSIDSAVSAGDFDRDDKLDLAATFANGVSDVLMVLRGNGDATFASAITYPTQLGSKSVVVGDFNADSNPDLVVANQNSNSVSLFLNGIIFRAGFE